MKKLDFSKLNDDNKKSFASSIKVVQIDDSEGLGLSTIKDEQAEDSRVDRHDEAVVNMLQNNDSLRNSSARKNDYRIQAITSKFSEEDDSEPSSLLLTRYKAGK